MGQWPWGSFPSVSMQHREQPGLFSPAPSMSWCLSQETCICPASTCLCAPTLPFTRSSCLLAFFLSWTLPSRDQTLPSSPHLPCPLPRPPSRAAQAGGAPAAVPAAGGCRALGTHSTATAPLKGTAAPGGQRGVSASPSAPGLGASNGTRKWKPVTPRIHCSHDQEILNPGCLQPLWPAPLLRTAQEA